MPFIPHTDNDVRQMLAAIGINQIDQLFDEIPARLKGASLAKIPEGMSELEITRLMQQRASQDGTPMVFAGAGAYEHHIPAAVWQIATRGEFYSAYTPYQAEASQGTLQLLYEFQTMMTRLTGMDVSNASLYDGATALAEGILMAIRSHKMPKPKRILMPRTVHPAYRKTAHTIVKNQGIELVEVDYQRQDGCIDPASLDAFGDDFSALVIPQPNFFGVLEEVDQLTDWAHSKGALVVGVVNPTSLALLKPPSEWGARGADIVVGDGQPLGIPLSSGGPYFGFCCCKKEFVRQMPGRIVGRTVDLEGKTGYTLTLQAREQHIRRSKATSNICTNQGLMVTAATIYMSLLGPDGLSQVAESSMYNTQQLSQKLAKLKGVKPLFKRPSFHEVAVSIPVDTDKTLQSLASQNIVGGYNLKAEYPELGDALLVCCTETKTDDDMNLFVDQLKKLIN